MASQLKKSTVVRLFSRSSASEDEEELSVRSTPQAVAKPDAASAEVAGLDGKVPAWFLIGPNGSGKTTFARWAGERAEAEGRSTGMFALDPGKRALADFFEGVNQPQTKNPATIEGFLRDGLRWLVDNASPTLWDMGGGNLALDRLLDTTPDTVKVMGESGVALIPAFFLGPRVADLGLLADLRDRGLKERVVIVLNHAMLDVTQDADEAFAAIRRHSEFRAALEDGATVLNMPRLDPPDLPLEIERKRLSFRNARDGVVPDGRKVQPIGGLDRASVRGWMDRMSESFAPVRPWLP